MATTELTYKGYTGSIEVSIEDECLHGRVLFIDDLITYEGNTVEEIKIAFQNATDRYIAYCLKTGKPANKPYSGTFNVRIGSSRHRALAQQAHKEKTSINDVVCKAIDIQQASINQSTFVTVQASTEAAIVEKTEVTTFYKMESQSPINPTSSTSSTTATRFDLWSTHSSPGNC